MNLQKIIEQVEIAMEEARDRDQILTALLVAANQLVEEAQIFSVGQGELKGLFAYRDGRVDRESVKHLRLSLKTLSVLCQSVHNRILYVGPVAETDSCVNICNPDLLAPKGLVSLPVPIGPKVVCLLIGYPRGAITLELRNTLDELRSLTSMALERYIMETRHQKTQIAASPMDQQNQPSIVPAPTMIQGVANPRSTPLVIGTGMTSSLSPLTHTIAAASGVAQTAQVAEADPVIAPPVVSTTLQVVKANAAPSDDVLKPSDSEEEEASNMKGDEAKISENPEDAQNKLKQGLEPTIDNSAVPVERRKYTRFPLNVEVDYMSDHNFYTGFMEDIGEGGLFVSTYGLFEIGHQFILSFSLPSITDAIEVKCEVRWVREYNPLSDALPGMGLQFLDLDPKIASMINRFMKHRDPLFYDD